MRCLLSVFLLLAFVKSYAYENRCYLGDWYFMNEGRPKIQEGFIYPETAQAPGFVRPAPLYDENYPFPGMFRAQVPGCVHTDISNFYPAQSFYAGNNENSPLAGRVEKENWIYKTTFDCENKYLPGDEAAYYEELVFEGLDTYAKVYLNDSLILEADNMFRKWVIPVNGILRQGKNVLEVHFMSPLNYHRETLENASYRLPSGNETGPQQVSCYTRKAAYQFGWDFGPRFVTCGIWKPCYLRSIHRFHISDFYAETESISNGNANMAFHFTLESDSTHEAPIKVEMLGHEFEIYVKKGKQQVEFSHEIKDVKLWYPNGHGDHPMYSTTINLFDSSEEKVHSHNVSFGVRTIELINERDSIGTSFYFKVNGKPVFIKGSNYIPEDIFPTQISHNSGKSLIEMVKELNMNMIRVWGGGIYESDYFYEQCDLNGIMVWQDFMFANSMYPVDTAFHHTVKKEIEDNVIRLRNHPCIALWCGNNEIEVAWHNWGWQKQYGYSAKDSAEIWNNYKSIFHEMIPQTLAAIDPLRPYIPSSPQSNWGKKENFNHGAMHYWGVWHGREPLDSFKTNVGRFMVEYGFQSYSGIYDEFIYPHIHEINARPDSSFALTMQKSYIGNGLLKVEIEKYFGQLRRLDDWMLASQYIQAQGLKTAIQAHRLAVPHCMGTMFWQLNDCWPGPSWSIIAYHHFPKMAFDVVKNCFSPTIAVVDTTDQEFSVTVVSDVPIEGTLLLSASSPRESGLKLVEVDFSVGALIPLKVFSMNKRKFFKKIPYWKDVELYLTIRDKETNDFVYDDIILLRKPGINEI